MTLKQAMGDNDVDSILDDIDDDDPYWGVNDGTGDILEDNVWCDEYYNDVEGESDDDL